MFCKDKKSYRYFTDAGKTVFYLKRQGIRRWIYLCPECSLFHLTSQQPPSAKERKKQEKRGNRRLGKADFKKMGIFERSS